jgi:hypothetical protein
MMKSPPKKKQKQEFSYVDKASIVSNLIAAREQHTKENRHLFLNALKECSKMNDISEATLLNWMKPSRRKHIYQKAEEFGNGDIKTVPLCSLSPAYSVGSQSLVNNDKSSR